MMANVNDGVTFNGVHCSSVGLELAWSERPLLPETKTTFVEIPFRQGDQVIFDDTYKDITIKCAFNILATNESFFDHIRRIANYFKTAYKQDLIFDDDPNYFYRAIPISTVTYEQLGKYGSFEIEFRCNAEAERID